MARAITGRGRLALRCDRGGHHLDFGGLLQRQRLPDRRAESENYGLYLVQTIDAASLDLYAGWRRFTYSDRTGTSYQDADGFLSAAALPSERG
jgi:hypothetical protein